MGADQSHVLKPMVSRKLKDIKSQRDELKTSIDQFVNKLSVECTALSDKATSQTYKDFPVLFKNLEDVSHMLRKMQDKIRDSAGGGYAILETESEGKYAALLSRVEKLEAMSATTRSQCDELQQTHQANLESQTDKNKEMDKMMVKVSSLERKTDCLETEVKSVEKRQSTRLNDKVQEVLKSSNARIDKVTQDISDLTWTTSVLESNNSSLLKDVDKLKGVNGMEVSKFMKRTRTKQQQFKGRVEEVETKIGMLCELLSTKVVYLERCRDALNQASANVAKRSDLERECWENKRVAHLLSCRLKEIEKESAVGRKPPIGFTAQFQRSQKLKSGYYLRYFDHNLCDVGNTFNRKFGKFTAPGDGLYCFVLTIQQEDNRSFKVEFVKQDSDGVKSSLMEVEVGDESMCTVQGAFMLNGADSVSVQVSNFSGCLELHHSTTLSGWLVG